MGMTKQASLPKTQAATLAEIKRIEDSGEPAYRYGSRNTNGINLNAVNALVRKGMLRYVVTEIGPERREVTYVVSA